jgi:hypothetical protein
MRKQHITQQEISRSLITQFYEKKSHNNFFKTHNTIKNLPIVDHTILCQGIFHHTHNFMRQSLLLVLLLLIQNRTLFYKESHNNFFLLQHQIKLLSAR